MASFASSATTGGARKHAWTKIFTHGQDTSPKHGPLAPQQLKVWADVLAVSKDFMKEKTWAISTSKFKFTHGRDTLIPWTPLEVLSFMVGRYLTNQLSPGLLVVMGVDR